MSPIGFILEKLSYSWYYSEVYYISDIFREVIYKPHHIKYQQINYKVLQGFALGPQAFIYINDVCTFYLVNLLSFSIDDKVSKILLKSLSFKTFDNVLIILFLKMS